MSVGSLSQPNATALEQLAQRFRQEAQGTDASFAAILAYATGPAASVSFPSSAGPEQAGAADGIGAGLPTGSAVGVSKPEAPEGGLDGNDNPAGQQMGKPMEDLASAYDPGVGVSAGTGINTGADAAGVGPSPAAASQPAVHSQHHHAAAGAYGHAAGGNGTASDIVV